MRGKIPRTFTYNKDNLCEVIILLSSLVINSENRDQKEKKQYMSAFLFQQFPDHLGYINSSYKNARGGTPIKIKSACNWINKHVDDLGYKSQIVYFLVALAMIDGRINNKEDQVLRSIAEHLKLDLKEFDSIIAGHQEAYQRKVENERKQRRQSQPSQTSISKKKQMAKILEVDENASFEEIKKAYRMLVKLHHPDRFINNGPEQIQLAQERFVEIQLAYEYFEKLLG
ncbi:MAG: DnaJ domain-containing protein [Crocinitomicaceae bacterium]|nr:DnaJ domain-containing protein [Crocinitomicaceae bacterium]